MFSLKGYLYFCKDSQMQVRSVCSCEAECDLIMFSSHQVSLFLQRTWSEAKVTNGSFSCSGHIPHVRLHHIREWTCIGQNPSTAGYFTPVGSSCVRSFRVWWCAAEFVWRQGSSTSEMRQSWRKYVMWLKTSRSVPQPAILRVTRWNFYIVSLGLPNSCCCFISDFCSPRVNSTTFENKRKCQVKKDTFGKQSFCSQNDWYKIARIRERMTAVKRSNRAGFIAETSFKSWATPVENHATGLLCSQQIHEADVIARFSDLWRQNEAKSRKSPVILADRPRATTLSACLCVKSHCDTTSKCFGDEKVNFWFTKLFSGVNHQLCHQCDVEWVTRKCLAIQSVPTSCEFFYACRKN